PLVFASQQQLLEVRGHAAHAPLSHPGKWLDVGENGYLTNAYLADVCAAAQAKLFVSYATGGADWYPDHLSFMFSRRTPAPTRLQRHHTSSLKRDGPPDDHAPHAASPDPRHRCRRSHRLSYSDHVAGSRRAGDRTR